MARFAFLPENGITPRFLLRKGLAAVGRDAVVFAARRNQGIDILRQAPVDAVGRDFIIAEGVAEQVGISAVARQLIDDVHHGGIHLLVADDGHQGLLFELQDVAVPVVELHEGQVLQGRHIAQAHPLVDAHSLRLVVGKGRRRAVAAGARHGVVAAELHVVEQLFAQ